jgi:nucleotide-binding universal stress UspA family protein
MTYRRTHLLLCPHGTPTSQGTVHYACGLSKVFDASLRVTSPRLVVTPSTHWLAGKMLASLANELEQTAAAKSAELVAYVRKQAAAVGLAVEIEAVPEPWPSSSDTLVIRGRTSDLNIIGLSSQSMEDRLNVEAWLFGTGRPCVLHPNDRALPFSLESVVIAWDLSKSAARAVGDALPMLKRAKSVHLLTVRGEKEIPSADPASPVIGYLAAHDIKAVHREVDIQGRRIGAAIVSYAAEVRADLLVMGAFGHSRLKEFVLGGATKEVLDAAPVPLLLAH